MNSQLQSLNHPGHEQRYAGSQTGAGAASAEPDLKPKRRASTDRKVYLLALPILIFSAITFVLPVMLVARASVASPGPFGNTGFTLSNFQLFLSDSYYWGVLLYTVGASILAVICTALVGVPLAYAMVMNPNIRSLGMLMISAPMVINGVVRIFGLEALIRTLGLPMVNNLPAVILGYTAFLLPYMALPVYAALLKLDKSLPEAARTLGASSFWVWRAVIIPLIRPAMMVGCILVFAMAAGAYLVPSMLGGGRTSVMPTLIYDSLTTSGDISMASAIAVILIAIVVPAMIIAGKLGSQSETRALH